MVCGNESTTVKGKVGVLLLVGLSLTACHKKAPANVVLPQVSPQPRPAPPPNPDTIQRSQLTKRVQQVTSILQQLATTPENTVPDAVLNATRCLLVAPQVPNGASQHVPALMTCRKGEQWSAPAFVNVDCSGMVRGTSDLLWMTNDEGMNALLTGGPAALSLRRQAGPLVRQAGLVVQTQLAADVFGYVRQRGRLSGSPVTISAVHPDETASQSFYGKTAGAPQLLDAKFGPPPVVEPFATAVVSYFNIIAPVGILIHHSGVVPVKVASQLREQVIEMIAEFHARRGFEILCFGRVYHVAYHYLILPNGTVQPGRPERCQGAHARGYNSFLGIALVGNFSHMENPSGLYGPSSPTAAQMHSLIRLCRRLRTRYNIPIQRVMRHSDVSGTECPGDRFPLQALLRALEQKGPSS